MIILAKCVIFLALFRRFFQLKTALIIVFIVISILLSIIVMMQEGKEGGLTSSISGGGSDTYWSKNKGKSKESILRKITAFLGFLFMLIALLLASKYFN